MATPTTLPASFTAGQVLTAAQMNNLRGAFRVLQVVSTTKTDTFTSTSTSFTDITGLSVSITPTSTTSKVLVTASVSGSQDVGAALIGLRLVRDSTAIAVGTASGSRTPATSSMYSGDTSGQSSSTMQFLDSPATTSATTYKVQGITNAGTFFINRSDASLNTNFEYLTVSTITVMEISA
jgi:hypothetical protein